MFVFVSEMKCVDDCEYTPKYDDVVRSISFNNFLQLHHPLLDRYQQLGLQIYEMFVIIIGFFVSINSHDARVWGDQHILVLIFSHKLASNICIVQFCPDFYENLNFIT